MKDETRRAFCQLTQNAGKESALALARTVLTNPQSLAAIDNLAEIFATLSMLGLGENFDIDLGDAGGLEYYTGLTFKVFIPEWGTAIGSGGRYDNLIGNFGAPEPAVGFSFSLDGLAAAIGQRSTNGISRESPLAEQLIVIEDQIDRSFEKARELRSRGKRVRIECQKGKAKD
jgi:ATP phosphoribosyltransferase regulatory subunit